MDLRVPGILLLLCLSGCSSIHAGFEAVNAEGIRPRDILACADRTCFEQLSDTDIVERRDLPDGTTEIDYRFQVKENRGWALARSVGHYLLGMATYGAWEVFGGTPIEAGLEVLGNRRYTAQVTFDSAGQMLEFQPRDKLKDSIEALQTPEAEESLPDADPRLARHGGAIWADSRPSGDIRVASAPTPQNASRQIADANAGQAVDPRLARHGGAIWAEPRRPDASTRVASVATLTPPAHQEPGGFRHISDGL